MNVLAGDLQGDLGLTEFGSARNTGEPGAIANLLAPLLRRISLPLFRLLNRVAGASDD